MGAHEIVISADDRPGREELVQLYDAVGWTTYTLDPDLLVAALAGSTRVVTARYGEDLLGLARVLSDGATIAYLQDVLVRPELQREGVGRQLVHAALEPFEHVRQKVLLTDDEPRQRAFYESLGYSELRDHGDGRLRAFVRFDGVGAPSGDEDQPAGVYEWQGPEEEDAGQQPVGATSVHA